MKTILNFLATAVVAFSLAGAASAQTPDTLGGTGLSVGAWGALGAAAVVLGVALTGDSDDDNEAASTTATSE
jgi:hypothetical protein